MPAHLVIAALACVAASPARAQAQQEGPEALTPAQPGRAGSVHQLQDPSLPPPYAPLVPAEGTIIEVPVAGPAYGATQPAAPPLARRERRRARWAPPRTPGHRFGLDIMGFGGDIGGAAFAADWRYRAQRPFFALARLGPLAVGRAGPDRIGVADASFVLGYDGRLFAAGAGIGVTYLRIDESFRRAQGTSAIGRLHFRAGALDGLNAQLDIGGALVDQTLVGTHFNLRFRFPLRRGRLLDVVLEVMPAASWTQLQVGWLMQIPWLPDSRWRIRPHAGLVEIIDAVGRDGGAAFGAGVQLVYLGGAAASDPR